MTTVGNVGIGLIVLTILWIITLVIFVAGVKLQSNISWVVLALATSVTVILLVIPVEKNAVGDVVVDTEDKDYQIVYKSLLLGLLGITTLLGFISFLILHCMEPVRPRPIKSFTED